MSPAASPIELGQRGYAAALSNPSVMQAIESGPRRRIAIAFVEWASATSQKLVIDWTLIENHDDAESFAGRLSRIAPVLFRLHGHRRGHRLLPRPIREEPL